MEREQGRRKLGIFGGTYEGRLLVEFCRREGIPFSVSVATAYGEQLLEEERGAGKVSGENVGENIGEKQADIREIRKGRMDAEEMADWMREQGVTDIVDATHPFAEEASKQIREACALMGVDYQRLSRAGLDEGMEAGWLKRQEAGVCWVSSVEEAAKVLNRELLRYPERRALLTTGSKELSWFSAEKMLLSRIFVRVLPSAEAIQACMDAGFCGKQIIAMQGPFSCELNRAILHTVQASYLVTKESGRTGGFEEKIQAALECGCRVIAVRRPDERGEGKSLEEIKQWLNGWKESKESQDGQFLDETPLHEIYLVGIGMGGLGQMSWEGLEVLLRADAFLGARRMVESGKAMCRDYQIETAGKRVVSEKERLRDKQECITWKKEEMLSWINMHPEARCLAVLFSGDIGFYSGAKGLLELLNEQLNGQYRIGLIPGISSLSYLAAKIGRTWEGVEAVSFHGREEEVDWTLADGRERFFLLDGTERLRQICRCLLEHGQAEAEIWVGENLSYPTEKIISGRPQKLLEHEFGTLLAAWVIPGAARQ